MKQIRRGKWVVELYAGKCGWTIHAEHDDYEELAVDGYIMKSALMDDRSMWEMRVEDAASGDPLLSVLLPGQCRAKARDLLVYHMLFDLIFARSAKRIRAERRNVK